MLRQRGRAHVTVIRAAVLAVALALPALIGGGGAEPAAAQIGGGLNVGLSAAPSVAQVGQTVTFFYRASPPAVAPPFPAVRLTIQFGDGAIFGPIQGGPGQTLEGVARHTYRSPGTYTAILDASASNGQANVTTTTVTVQRVQCGPPQVTLNASTRTATPGQPVIYSFTATAGAGCTQQNAPLPSLLISFGDGGAPLPLTSLSGTITRTFPAPGAYTALLTANSGGQIGQASTTVLVGQACGPPTVQLTAAPQVAQTGVPVTYNYSAQAGPGCTQQNAPLPTLLINFGDGSAPLPLNGLAGAINRTYNAAGVYTAVVTATSGSQQSRASTTVAVNQTCEPPSGSLRASPTSAAIGDSILFTYSAVAGAGCTQQTAPLPTITINFGDGAAPVQVGGVDGSVRHSYANTGTYVASVIITSGAQVDHETATVTITAGAPPPPPSGLGIRTATGWNLVSGPEGTVVTGASGPLYTFGPDDTAYEVVPAGTPLAAGVGYWAFFPTAGTFSLPIGPARPYTIQAPAGRYFMIGNPGDTAATVSGADIVYTYNSTTSAYVASNTIPAGSGAWVLSLAGGRITVTNTAP